MKKEIVMIYKIALSLVLLVLSSSAFSQKYDSIEVSNSKESDEINITSVGFRTGNLLCVEIVKTLPLPKFGNKEDYRWEYIYQQPNSQKAILKMYFLDGKFLKGDIERKAMKKIFNGSFQKRGRLVEKDVSTEKFLVEENKVEGIFKIKLPFSFGWLNSDTLVKVDFKTRIFDTPSEQVLNPGLVQSYSIKPNLIDGLAKVYYESCTVEKDTLNPILNFTIGVSNDMVSSLVYIKLPNERTRTVKITSCDYSDIEEEKTYYYPYYKLEFNRNPFIESDIPLIGRYLIATDSLPGKYGDPEIRSGYFKCE
ncbi:hypothetical protein ACT3CE_15785 [Marinifilum sp. RC60d5]|uniref:hypothetical protein n=1 Tax=Marinifilum sp. RC60d5 TaxID=3458414 RepID=UPI0040371D79